MSRSGRGSIHGYEVASGLPLARLSAVRGVRGRISLERGGDGLLDRPGELTAWYEWPERDGLAFALARANGAVLAWCSIIGAFEMDPARAAIRVAAETVDEMCEHRLGAIAVPLLLSELGDVALHAAAIDVGGRGVLFCGPSGRGKSTLALMASRLGHPVLTEDGAVVALERPDPIVWPGARGVRVDHHPAGAIRPRASEAAGVEPGRQRRLQMLAPHLDAAGPAPVAAVCHLAERGPKLAVRELSPWEALPVLAPSLMHAGGPTSLRPAFGRLVRLLERVPAFRVSMPDCIGDAPDATRSLLSQVLP
jgi:hypothetical protein